MIAKVAADQSATRVYTVSEDLVIIPAQLALMLTQKQVARRMLPASRQRLIPRL